jgi:hypothetical protein
MMLPSERLRFAFDRERDLEERILSLFRRFRPCVPDRPGKSAGGVHEAGLHDRGRRIGTTSCERV